MKSSLSSGKNLIGDVLSSIVNVQKLIPLLASQDVTTQKKALWILYKMISEQQQRDRMMQQNFEVLDMVIGLMQRGSDPEIVHFSAKVLYYLSKNASAREILKKSQKIIADVMAKFGQYGAVVKEMLRLNVALGGLSAKSIEQLAQLLSTDQQKEALQIMSVQIINKADLEIPKNLYSLIYGWFSQERVVRILALNITMHLSIRHPQTVLKTKGHIAMADCLRSQLGDIDAVKYIVNSVVHLSQHTDTLFPLFSLSFVQILKTDFPEAMKLEILTAIFVLTTSEENKSYLISWEISKALKFTTKSEVDYVWGVVEVIRHLTFDAASGLSLGTLAPILASGFVFANADVSSRLIKCLNQLYSVGNLSNLHQLMGDEIAIVKQYKPEDQSIDRVEFDRLRTFLHLDMPNTPNMPKDSGVSQLFNQLPELSKSLSEFQSAEMLVRRELSDQVSQIRDQMEALENKANSISQKIDATGNRAQARLIQPVTNEVVVSDVEYSYTKEEQEDAMLTDNKSESNFESPESIFSRNEEEKSVRIHHSHYNSLQSVQQSVPGVPSHRSSVHTEAEHRAQLPSEASFRGDHATAEDSQVSQRFDFRGHHATAEDAPVSPRFDVPEPNFSYQFRSQGPAKKDRVPLTLLSQESKATKRVVTTFPLPPDTPKEDFPVPDRPSLYGQKKTPSQDFGNLYKSYYSKVDPNETNSRFYPKSKIRRVDSTNSEAEGKDPTSPFNPRNFRSKTPNESELPNITTPRAPQRPPNPVKPIEQPTTLPSLRSQSVSRERMVQSPRAAKLFQGIADEDARMTKTFDDSAPSPKPPTARFSGRSQTPNRSRNDSRGSMRSQVSLPKIDTIPIAENQGLETILMNENLLTVDFADKEEQGRRLRNLLSLGNIEVRGIQKETGCASLHELVGWYKTNLYTKSAEEVQEELQKAIISASRTAKMIAVLILLLKQV